MSWKGGSMHPVRQVGRETRHAWLSKAAPPAFERFCLVFLTTRAGTEQSKKRLDQQLVGSRTSGLRLTQVWGRPTLTPSNSIHHLRVEPSVLVITNMKDNRPMRKEFIVFFLTQSSHFIWELSLVCFHMIYVSSQDSSWRGW